MQGKLLLGRKFAVGTSQTKSWELAASSGWRLRFGIVYVSDGMHLGSKTKGPSRSVTRSQVVPKTASTSRPESSHAAPRSVVCPAKFGAACVSFLIFVI